MSDAIREQLALRVAQLQTSYACVCEQLDIAVHMLAATQGISDKAVSTLIAQLADANLLACKPAKRWEDSGWNDLPAELQRLKPVKHEGEK